MKDHKMTKKTTIALRPTKNKWVNGKLDLVIDGKPLELNFRVPSKPVKLRRMLPVFQQFSNRFNEIPIESLKAEGKEISCKAGCGACCRHAVPISESEAIDLLDVLDAMPEERQAEIRLRFAHGMEKLNAISFFERYEKRKDESELAKLILEYFAQGIPCPFLENESCSIHGSRPISCRDYLVTSPAKNCASLTGEGVDRVKYQYNVKKAFFAINRDPELKDEKASFLPMIRMLEWSKEHGSDDSPTLEGIDWMQKFLAELFGQSGTRTPKQPPDAA